MDGLEKIECFLDIRTWFDCICGRVVLDLGKKWASVTDTALPPTEVLRRRALMARSMKVALIELVRVGF